jgi:hypothetical protein
MSSMFFEKLLAKLCLKASNIFFNVLPPNIHQCLQWIIVGATGTINIFCDQIHNPLWKPIQIQVELSQLGMCVTITILVHLMQTSKYRYTNQTALSSGIGPCTNMETHRPMHFKGSIQPIHFEHETGPYTLSIQPAKISWHVLSMPMYNVVGMFWTWKLTEWVAM